MAQGVSTPVAGTAVPVRPPQDASPLAEMLAREPSRAVRRFLYFLLFLFFAAFLASAILEFDVTVIAPAVLRPEGKTLLVQPENEGVVVEVQVKEGDTVRAGEVLAVLESEKAGEQLLALSDAAQKLREAVRETSVIIPAARRITQDEIKTLQGQLADLTREQEFLTRRQRYEQQAFAFLTESNREQLRKQDEIDKRNVAALQSAEENLNYRKKQLETFERLVREQAVGVLEVMNTKREYVDARVNYERIMSQQREAKNDRALTEKTYQRESALHLARLAELTQQLEHTLFQSRTAQFTIVKLQGDLRLKQLEAESKELAARFGLQLARQRAELNRGEDNREAVRKILEGGVPPVSRLVMTAPVAGRIGTVAIKGRGESVERGKTLFTLLPEGSLVAEVKVANRDVALLEPGQTVKLKLEAFPYAEYGSLTGELANVSPEAEGVDTPAESFYRATARLDAQKMRNVPLLAGMTATAEIVTERKTLLQLLLTPFQQ